MSDLSPAGRPSLAHATVCLVIPNQISILCQAAGVMGERIPFFLMPKGLAAVEAAAGFAPASPTVVDMVTKGCRKLSCQILEPRN